MSTAKYTVSIVLEIHKDEFFTAAFTYGYRTVESYIRDTLISQLKEIDPSKISIVKDFESETSPWHEKSLG